MKRQTLREEKKQKKGKRESVEKTANIYIQKKRKSVSDSFLTDNTNKGMEERRAQWLKKGREIYIKKMAGEGSGIDMWV